MKFSHLKRKGMTMIELCVTTVMIGAMCTVVMIMVSVIVAAVDKSTCLSNISCGQKAVRAISNFEDLMMGDMIYDDVYNNIRSVYPGMNCNLGTELQKAEPWGSYARTRVVPFSGEMFLRCKNGEDILFFKHIPKEDMTGDSIRVTDDGFVDASGRPVDE